MIETRCSSRCFGNMSASYFGNWHIRSPGPQSVIARLRDLSLRIDLGNGHDFALSWSRNWFAGIGHNEMNPARLERLSRFWSHEYSAVQKVLKAAVRTSRI